MAPWRGNGSVQTHQRAIHAAVMAWWQGKVVVVDKSGPRSSVEGVPRIVLPSLSNVISLLSLVYVANLNAVCMVRFVIFLS
jgi:hypothetical protein